MISNKIIKRNDDTQWPITISSISTLFLLENENHSSNFGFHHQLFPQLKGNLFSIVSKNVHIHEIIVL